MSQNLSSAAVVIEALRVNFLFESFLPQMLVRIANSDVTDLTALGLHCLSMTSGQVEQG